MNLFITTTQFQKLSSNKLSFPTPIGNVQFNLILDTIDICNTIPSKIETFEKTIISTWNLEQCRIEFLQSKFIPKIPPKIHIEDCFAGIWRIKNSNNKTKFTFKTYLETEDSSKLKSFSESGEGVICQTLENDHVKISIGTEDEEYLATRAIQNQWMPSRFQNILDCNTIKCLSNGLEIFLPPLEKYECLQIQSIIAWSFAKKSDSATWFSVDQNPDYILKSININ